jgi:hypothetical protein
MQLYINDPNYSLIHDICLIILKQILYKNKLQEFKEFLLSL